MNLFRLHGRMFLLVKPEQVEYKGLVLFLVTNHPSGGAVSRILLLLRSTPEAAL